MNTYIHVKTGVQYELLFHGILEKDCIPCVIYMNDSTGAIWVRPSREFFDGRFKMVTDAEEPSGKTLYPRTHPGVQAKDPTSYKEAVGKPQKELADDWTILACGCHKDIICETCENKGWIFYNMETRQTLPPSQVNDVSVK